MKKQIIARGAEAIITLQKNRIIKNRIKKDYRLPELDNKLRKQRTKKEIRLLEKSSKLIPVPEVISSTEVEIELEYIRGKRLSECFDNLENSKEICKLIGRNIAKLHDANIIHGDLTTSNMILDKNKKIFIIDFGLGFESARIEDKAVDLHVLKEALEARHFSHSEKFWLIIINSYKSSKNSIKVLQHLQKVEKRGRYKKNY